MNKSLMLIVDECCRDLKAHIVPVNYLYIFTNPKLRGRINVECLREFLLSPNEEVCTFTSQLIVLHDNPQFVIEAVLERMQRKILDVSNICRTLSYLAQPNINLIGLCELIWCENRIIKEAVIQMFRKGKQLNYLFPLLFDRDPQLVDTIKQYIEKDSLNEKQ